MGKLVSMRWMLLVAVLGACAGEDTPTNGEVCDALYDVAHAREGRCGADLIWPGPLWFPEEQCCVLKEKCDQPVDFTDDDVASCMAAYRDAPCDATYYPLPACNAIAFNW